MSVIDGARRAGDHMLRVPFCDVAALDAPLRPALSDAIGRVLASGRYVLGAQVEAFERAAAAYLGVPHAIGVSSGTDALMLALAALDIGPGDTVIVPASTYFADVEAVARVGARPLPVDVDGRGLPALDALAAAWTPSCRAVIATHLHGGAAPLDGLKRWLDARGVALIEDACQAFGARRDGRAAGTLGAFGCYSFYPTKVLGGAGDGGLVVTHDGSLAGRVRRLRRHGADPADKYRHLELGHNCRLDAIQAAFLRVKLSHLDDAIEARRQRAAVYRRTLAGLPLRLPPDDPAEAHTYYAFAIRCADGPTRDRLRAALAEAGVEAPIHFPLTVGEQPAFGDRFGPAPPDPAARRRARTILSLPCHPALGAAAQRHVIDAIHRVFDGAPCDSSTA